MKINITLTRERFSIFDIGHDGKDKRLHTTALSTRISVVFGGAGSIPEERFIIRAKNMHSCTRMTARLVYEYTKRGPFQHRATPVNWGEYWDTVLTPYEQHYVPDTWCTIYHNGSKIFDCGAHHPFLDIIEKCNAVKKSDYEKAILVAEDAFKQAGKNMNIVYDGNIAYVGEFDTKNARCSMILRGPGRSTTFNFSITSKDPQDNPLPSAIISASAAFLEAIQLAYMIGMNNAKIKMGLIEQYSPEEKQTREAGKRLAQMNAEINVLDNRYNVRFRPERPDFFAIIDHTEKFGRKTLKPLKKENDEEEIWIE